MPLVPLMAMSSTIAISGKFIIISIAISLERKSARLGAA